MRRGEALARLRRRLSPVARRRGASLRRFYKDLAFVSFGTVNQHDDEVNVIRGFSASLTHQDLHYAVGEYGGYDVRVVDRFDIIRTKEIRNHLQQWVIIEIDLRHPDLRHIAFIPTGSVSAEYARLFATQPHMQPINSLLLDNKSPEFHGRFQILARTTHLQDFERIFSSPIIAGMAARFWPHGIEIEHGKLLVYITEHRLTKAVLESTLASALWLAETIDESVE